MLSKNRIAGKFKFPDRDQFENSSIYELMTIFLSYGYGISIEPKDNEWLVDVYEPDHFENRPLPFGEDV